MKIIPTTYKGVKFRSRTEARWAVFFDFLDWKWQYEVEGFEFEDGTRYLPDFYFPELDMYAEVKGKEFTQEELRKCGIFYINGAKSPLIGSAVGG